MVKYLPGKYQAGIWLKKFFIQFEFTDYRLTSLCVSANRIMEYGLIYNSIYFIDCFNRSEKTFHNIVAIFPCINYKRIIIMINKMLQSTEMLQTNLSVKGTNNWFLEILFFIALFWTGAHVTTCRLHNFGCNPGNWPGWLGILPNYFTWDGPTPSLTPPLCLSKNTKN